jgi:hypothetical protein
MRLGPFRISVLVGCGRRLEGPRCPIRSTRRVRLLQSQRRTAVRPTSRQSQIAAKTPLSATLAVAGRDLPSNS